MSNNNTVVKNTILRALVRRFPGLVTRETAHSLLRNDVISQEAAADIISVTETTDPEHANQKNNGSIIPADSISDFKLDAALEILKIDDRTTYDEFLRVDSDRNALVAKIVGNYNNDVNLIIGVLKTAPGTDIKAIDEILQSPIVADKAGFGFSTRQNVPINRV